MKFDEFRSLLIEDRSIRRFDGKRVIEPQVMQDLVELTRYCASGRNLQPLRYRLICDTNEARAIEPHLKWAGYLPEWGGPKGNERPNNYIIQCLDTELATNCMCDDGLHLQAITLGAASLGIGCCIIKSFDIVKIREILDLPDRYAPLYIIATGYPVECVKIEDTDGSIDADIKYYRTPDGIHHVPKRPLSELLI